MSMKERIYYQDQSDWTDADYEVLHRYLSKMIEHAHDTVGSSDGNLRMKEILSLQTDHMTEETKVLLYCVVLSQNPTLMNECDNLKQLSNVSPLSKRLVLCPFKHSGAEIYREYNVLY